MPFDVTQRRVLLTLARSAIDRGLCDGRLPAWTSDGVPPELRVERATFVTLTIGGELRGCCGMLQATRSVAEDVWRNAWASAFADPRFAQLTRAEFARITVQVSVLSPLEALTAPTERELLAALRPGVDGLVLELGAQRATFLPAVWAQLPDAPLFLAQLKAKAGWPRDFWSPQLRCLRYTTECFGEQAPQPAPQGTLA